MQSKTKVRLYQIPGFGFPGLHAESFQTARMAEAFLECGVNATIVYPWSSRMIPWRDVGATYGVHRSLKRKILPGFYLTSSRWRSFTNPLLRISLALFAIKSGRKSVFIGRHPHLDPVATLIWLKARNLLRASIFIELHEPHHYLAAVDSSIDGYIVVSEALKLFLIQAGVIAERILLAPNAVDLRSYEEAHEHGRPALRKQLGLPESHAVICYAGQLGPGRNVETLIAAMRNVEESAILVLVGGKNSDDVQRVQTFIDSNQLSHRVRLVGQQPATTVTHFQLAADVLVIPYDSRLSHSKWCSPLKLWEYLASGKPIVAFSIPALRQVLLDNEVVWAKEETSIGLAEAIKEALTRDPRPFQEIRARLSDSTWGDRARHIANFMGVKQRRIVRLEPIEQACGIDQQSNHVAVADR